MPEIEEPVLTRLAVRSPRAVFLGLAALVCVAPGSACLWSNLQYLAPLPVLIAYGATLFVCLRGGPPQTRAAIVRVFAQAGMLVGLGVPATFFAGGLLLSLGSSEPAQGLTIGGSVLMILMMGTVVAAFGSVVGVVGGAFAGWVTSIIGFKCVNERSPSDCPQNSL